MAKQKYDPSATKMEKGFKLEHVEENWTLDPSLFMEWMFHALKQELHFIQRKPDRQAVAELKAFVGSNPLAVEAIFFDYNNNTEMRLLRYGKRGFMEFKKYYDMLLEAEEIKVEEK